MQRIEASNASGHCVDGACGEELGICGIWGIIAELLNFARQFLAAMAY
jgi:hypothetical protein